MRILKKKSFGSVFMILAGLLMMVNFNACATIFSDGEDTITFNANVDKVKVFFDNSLVGETPLTLPVERKLHRTQVKFTKEGYETQEMLLAHKFNMNGGMILDITGTVLTLTPMAVDALSGNLIRYSPTDYHIEMVPVKAGDLDLFRRRVDSKKFAALNFHDIRRNLLSGGGEFLDGLVASFQVPPSHHDEFMAAIDDQRERLVLSSHGLALWDRLNRTLQDHPRLSAYSLE